MEVIKKVLSSKNNKDSKKYSIKIDEERYTKFRKDLHQIPELGYEEIETKAYILSHIKKFKNFDKLKLKEIGKTGFFFDVLGEGKVNPDLKPARESQTHGIAFRTDLDGLPLDEETGCDYPSKNRGKAHACGHDGHMTMLTCFMEYMLERLYLVPSNVNLRFIYQPAEEGLAGAAKMIIGGCLAGINEIFGIHNLSIFEVGCIGIKSGPVMAAIELFDIEITGIGGHGSTPNKTISPITTASEIVLKLNQITSQMIDSKDRCVLSVGCLQSGETNNVIPEKAIIKGSVRTFDKDVLDKIMSHFRQIVNGIAEVNGAKVEITYVTPGIVTDNDKDLTDNVVIPSIKKSGFKYSDEGLPVTGSEDFSFYQAYVPGVFIMVGTGDKDHTSYIHSPQYNYNDLATPYAVETYVRILEEILKVELL